MPTPQTNTSLSKIAERLSALDDFVICGHINPDGDCLGSQLALCQALRAMGKTAHCVLAKADPIEANLMFLPGVEEIEVASEYQGPISVFIAVDVPTVERIGLAVELQSKASVRFTIDHHATEGSMSEYNYVDPDSPSASMLVWEVCKYLDSVTPEVAQCALTGLVTDTGRFSYQNTNSQAFVSASEMMKAGADPTQISREFFQSRSLASMKLEGIVLDRMELLCEGAFVYSFLGKDDFDACGAIKADAEALIDTLRNIRGVRVALILKQTVAGEVRGSLRAKDDDTDVAQVARYFGGGGHKAAAGFTYKGSLKAALDDVPVEVLKQCFSLSGGDC